MSLGNIQGNFFGIFAFWMMYVCIYDRIIYIYVYNDVSIYRIYIYIYNYNTEYRYPYPFSNSSMVQATGWLVKESSLFWAPFFKLKYDWEIELLTWMTVIAIQVRNGSEHRTSIDLVESLNAIHRVHIETDANRLAVGEADCSDLEYMRQHSLVALPPSPHPMVRPAISGGVDGRSTNRTSSTDSIGSASTSVSTQYQYYDYALVQCRETGTTIFLKNQKLAMCTSAPMHKEKRTLYNILCLDIYIRSTHTHYNGHIESGHPTKIWIEAPPRLNHVLLPKRGSRTTTLSWVSQWREDVLEGFFLGVGLLQEVNIRIYKYK